MEVEHGSVEHAERYLRGELPEAEAVAFEEHYFSCESCFARLRDLRTLRTALARSRRAVEAAPRVSRPVVWLAAAAAVIVLGLFGSSWLLRHGGPPSEADGGLTLADLARLTPPRWTPVRLRGVEDDAARRFREAMEPYSRGDFRAALPGLEEAARLDPGAADISFYRGACALLAGRTDEGVESLKQVVALGETPFLEEARFTLAKAHLRLGNVAAAQEELGKVVELDGDRREAARWLLSKLDALRTRSP